MLGIMAVMDHEDFYMLVVGPGSGMCKVVGIGSYAILGCILRRVGLRFRGGWCSQC